MSRWGSSAKIDVGGRSPKRGNGLEQVRASRRLGLTHSLDSPQVPESEPANPELPSRESSTGGLPRPRSFSPKRNPTPPSVTGSALSARIERTSTVRASKASPVSPPPPPPPRTRARFSVKVCDGASEEEEKAADAVEPAAEQDNKVMSTIHEFTNTSANLTVDIDGFRHDDATPVVVLPPAIAAQADDNAAERRMRHDREEREREQQQQQRVALPDAEAKVAERPRPPSSVMVTAASVFGIDSSQIQSNPQYLAPKKLSQSPVGRKSRSSIESPPLPMRLDPGSNAPLVKQRSSFFPSDRDDASDSGNYLVGGDENEETSGPSLRRGDASYNSSPSPPLPPPPRPRSPPPVSPTGMPAGFSATSIRRSRPGTSEDPTLSPTGTDAESALSQTFSASPLKRLSPGPGGGKRTPSSSWLGAAKPPPLLHTSASTLPIPPPETPTEDTSHPKPLPPPPLPTHPKPVPATSSRSSSERPVNASPNRTPLSSPEKNDQQHEQDDDNDIPTPPVKFYSSSSLSPQQQQLSRVGSSRVDIGGKGRGGAEAAIESDLDFIRELTQYRSNATRRERHDEYEFALVLKPNDEYRDAVEVLELALDLRDGAKLSKTPSPQKLDNARRVRESLAGLQPPNLNLGVSESSLGVEGSGSGARKPGPPQVRPGLSEGLEGGGCGARRQRLSLLDDLQEEGGMLTNRRRKELERKKKHRLMLFVEKMREGIIVRRHLAHHTCDQIVLQSTDECHTITWKPLLGGVNNSRVAKGGGGVGSSIGGGIFMGKLKRGRRTTRAESIKAAHIALVLPATDPDPSHPGFFGTRALRLSEDIANPARTFSLLYGDWGAWGATAAEQLPSGGNWTLDLECDDDVTYAMLFQGFLLLHMQTVPASDLSTPPKPVDDDMEAGSGARGRARPWTLRKSPSSRSSSGLTRIASGITSDGEEGSPPPPLGAAGNRGSLRNSLKFLPELLGGLSTSSKLSRRGSQRQMTSNVVIGSAPPEFFLGWTSPGTQIWSRLRMAGLEVEKLYSLDRRRVLLKIRLPKSKLEEVAEAMRLKLRKRDGTIGRFKKDHRSSFSQSADGDLFRSGESQKVIDHLIRAKIKDGGSELDVRTELGKHVCKRMPLHNQARLEALYNAWVVYWRPPPTLQPLAQQQQQQFRFRGRFKITGTAEESSSVEDEGYMTRSERLRERAEEAREVLLKASRLSAVVLRGSMWQPLEMIADYFGEATAFYFAWMGFYTQWLIVPSIFGVIVFAFQVHAGTLDHPMMTIYAVFVILWSSAFFVLWRQRCSELAYRWGVLNFEQEEQTRSQFWGREQLDDVTGRFEREYPVWKRWATYAVTMPIMVGFTAAVLLLMFTVIVKRDSASGVDRGMEDPEFWGIMLVKPMLYGIAIPILYGTCKRLGIFLNNLENHKTENKYRNALIVKVFSFRFVTVFASLYHYAFISREGSSNYKLLRLAASLCCFMTIGQWWYMIWMCYIPERVQNWKINKLKAKVEAERLKLEKAEADEAAGGGGGGAGEASRSVRRKLLDEAGDHLWEEALLKEYNLTDVFDDYTMSLIQFGYVALFSAAFPLAPLLAMINNLVQTRVDAHKICKTRRRPIALKSGGIGVWDNVLQLMTLIAVITNCALIGVTSTRWWPDDISPATQILVVVIVEHVILFLKYWLEYTVPRVPTKVQRALLRERMEREQKGIFADARGSDHFKFEANFSRALAGDNAAGGSGGGVGSLSKRTTTTNAGVSISSPSKVISVDENLTATTPTPGGRVRRGFSANLSGFVSSSGSTSTSPARSFASCTPPRSASTSTPEPREITATDRDSYDADLSTSARFQAPLPPPSASTVRAGSETFSCSTLPPLPPRRFGLDAESTQGS